MGIKVLGFGKALGDKLVLNDDFKHIDTSDEWIKTRTGIKSRYIAVNKTTTDLAYEAAIEAIKNSNINKNDIKIVICATMTADYITPTVSNIISKKLDLNCYSFDINVACSGFVYALDIASKLLTDGYALVIGVDKPSKILDFNDRSTCVLFGDAASSCIIKKDDNIFYKSYLKTLNDNDNILYCEGLKNNNLFENKKDYGYLTMIGKEVFLFAINAVNDCIKNLGTEFDILVPHQANSRIIDYIKKTNKLENVYVNLEKYGNTSSASVGLALYDMYKNNVFKNKKRVMLVGFGAGLAYGAILLDLEV